MNISLWFGRDHKLCNKVYDWLIHASYSCMGMAFSCIIIPLAELLRTFKSLKSVQNISIIIIIIIDRFLYSAILHSRADLLRSHVILHE